MLKEEFEYYLKNQSDLVKKFDGKYLVIKNNSVIGVYDRHDDAYFQTQKEHDLGTFLIQLCSPGNMAYTNTFYTENVSF